MLSRGGHAAILTLLSLAGCTGDAAAPPRVDLYVDRATCDVACVDQFLISMTHEIQGKPCVFAWSAKLGSSGEVALHDLDLEPGSVIRVQVVAYCGSDSCVRCSAIRTFQVGADSEVQLAMRRLGQCQEPLLVTTPCERCQASGTAYCDGNDRVTCVGGQTVKETCPQSCQRGTCSGCTTKTFYRDGDNDGHGDPASPIQACTKPAGAAESGEDCDDHDPLVHPGQTSYFTKPAKNSQTYDYNCNSLAEPRWPDEEDCAYDPKTGGCTGEGWVGIVPRCGATGFFAKCQLMQPTTICDRAIPAPTVQPCR
jgi:hypothetical protein